MEKIVEIKDYEAREGYSNVAGFEVLTTEQSIKLFIDNDSSCCERWGHFWCNDDPHDFVGAELRSVTLTDTALNEAQMKANDLNPNDKWFEGGVMFVNLETDKGTLQFVAYNEEQHDPRQQPTPSPRLPDRIETARPLSVRVPAADLGGQCKAAGDGSQDRTDSKRTSNLTVATTKVEAMESSVAEIPTIIGTAMGDGFYAGRIRIGEQVFALIVAPKSEGQHDDIEWNGSYKMVEGAASYFDGLTNTNAMVEAGSELAAWARGLRIGGHDDWYLPSQDELEIIYRNLKPTTDKNWCYARSGINLSAIEPTRPYTPNYPVQTLAEAFKAGGDEAFDNAWYWSSTQHVSFSGYAWLQTFGYGNQLSDDKDVKFIARAVRRLAI